MRRITLAILMLAALIAAPVLAQQQGHVVAMPDTLKWVEPATLPGTRLAVLQGDPSFEPVLFAVLMAEDPRQPAAREIAAVRDDTVAAVDRGDLDTAGVRFVDYWMGAGTWAGMPVPRRQAVASTMSKVKAEWLAVFTEPTPLSAFAALKVPTLCIVGSKSPASSRGVARLLAKTLPSVTTVEIDGVGHMAPVTHPDRVNTVIASYLERVTATG